MAAPLKLTRTHRILVGLVISGALVIAGIGFVGSYSAVRALAERKGFGQFSLVFPIGIDAGICVLLSLDLLLTWIRIPFPLLRQAAWVLTAATIAFNGAAAWPDPLGVGMHAVIPVLFVVSVEAARHAVGRIADITADKHMEGVRLTRWLLSPIPTFLLWRRMKLWELRSYEATIKLEQERLVYQARLHSRFGRAWRRKAPVESLMPLRLARYGVPLSDTAPAGLAAAGIEPVLLPPAPRSAELEPGAQPAQGADRSTEAPPRHEVAPPPGIDAMSPWFAAHPNRPYEGGYDPSYAPDQQYEQWYAQQQALAQAQGVPGPQQYVQGPQGPVPQEYAGQGQQAPGPGPYPDPQQFADAQQYAEAQQQYAEAQQRYAAEAGAGQPGGPGPAEQVGQVGPDGMPVDPAAMEGIDPATGNQFLVPAGPGRTRPLGGSPIPAPRMEQTAWSGAGEELPLPESGGEEPQPVGLPDGLSRDEAYFQAFRKYVGEHMDFPNARQFGLYLQDLYGIVGQSGGPLTERTLRPYVREFRERYQQNLDAEENIA
ncbi:DUF2637 domain-containing protein [Streptomyces sp. TS71-3]|uniref:DUF2637 domain-containing protein n=1 Tax=Streptomyces sp. TS71-3 TaxID=2733862 RepID=UPI001B2A13F7|nr:DUF2637 domain-containing protein [Streptomyces sp. TS71-3]GHJ34791.1 hypothetical protein Sm713_04000 [Streptomyces sp. TS71-3]